MESKRCEKTPGGGVATSAVPAGAASSSASQSHDVHLCTHVTAPGHRCHMLIVHPDATLCPDHLDKQRRAELRHTQSVSNTLFANMHDFTSPTSVNLFLGNLLREFSLKRIDRRDAIAMAYIGQLLLNSHAAIDRLYAAGFHEENPTAKILLQEKRELEISLDPRRQPGPNAPSAPASTNSPAVAQPGEPEKVVN